MTLKINTIQDLAKAKDYHHTKFGKNPLKDFHSRVFTINIDKNCKSRNDLDLRPMTLKIKTVQDLTKDYNHTKFGQNPMKVVNTRFGKVFTRLILAKIASLAMTLIFDL